VGQLKPNLGLGSAADIRDAIQQASLGGVLDPSALLAVLDTLTAVRALGSNLTRLSQQLPLLAQIAKSMDEVPDLASAIGGAVSRHAEIVDGASPALAALRSQVRTTHERLTHRLQDILTGAVARGIAQEALVTLRGGRYVIPIKADFRGQMRGIVHDVSSSGATAFVEPLAVVELGNAWREAELEEQREVERILRRLSSLVGDEEVALRADVAALAEIDLSLAKARLGDQMRAAELPVDGPEQPWIVEGPAELNLVDARHPLLPREAVPISIHVGRGFQVLLLTGPNTGGKTVALKTAGLLSLMAQSGLPVPAGEHSRIPVFADIFADIGDEQSIEQSLSTFSSHMRTIIAIVQQARPNTLVLLDELGAGTDPAEGAALARALIEYFLQSGCLTIATTHHGELKAYAQSVEGVSNGSVEFDPVTLAPTYHLVIGLPGRSNALAIATQLGMPPAIIQRAREEISPEQRQIEHLLSQIQEERDELSARARAERAAAQEAEQIRRDLAANRDAIEDERLGILDSAHSEVEEELRQARLQLREATQAMEREERDRAGLAALSAAMSALEEGSKSLERRRVRRRRVQPSRVAEPVQSRDLRTADRIWVRGIAQAGEVIAPPDERDEVDIQLGSLRTRVRVDQIERLEHPRNAARVTVSLSPPTTQPADIPEQIEVRGQRVDEALPKVEEYLAAAFEAGVSHVRVVHGKGTGTLRRVVRERLAHSPIVASFETAEPSAGGEGVTVVHLAV
jgi:DNA mismatch repair protein MutS2